MDFYSFMTQSELLLRIVALSAMNAKAGIRERGSELMQLCRLRRL